MPVASFLNLAGADFIIIAMIIGVLTAPAIIAILIVLYVSRRRKKPPPLPPRIGSQ
jgi:hypothetical protein